MYLLPAYPMQKEMSGAVVVQVWGCWPKGFFTKESITEQANDFQIKFNFPVKDLGTNNFPQK